MLPQPRRAIVDATMRKRRRMKFDHRLPVRRSKGKVKTGTGCRLPRALWLALNAGAASTALIASLSPPPGRP